MFDLDGTLMCETYPFCFEYMVFADYALNSGSDTVTDAVKAVAQEILDAAGGEKPSGMSARQAAAGAVAYRGMTMKRTVLTILLSAGIIGSAAWAADFSPAKTLTASNSSILSSRTIKSIAAPCPQPSMKSFQAPALKLS